MFTNKDTVQPCSTGNKWEGKIWKLPVSIQKPPAQLVLTGINHIDHSRHKNISVLVSFIANENCRSVNICSALNCRRKRTFRKLSTHQNAFTTSWWVKENFSRGKMIFGCSIHNVEFRQIRRLLLIQWRRKKFIHQFSFWREKSNKKCSTLSMLKSCVDKCLNILRKKIMNLVGTNFMIRNDFEWKH